MRIRVAAPPHHQDGQGKLVFDPPFNVRRGMHLSMRSVWRMDGFFHEVFLEMDLGAWVLWQLRRGWAWLWRKT